MHKLLVRLAVLAILATMTVACGKGSPTSPSGPSAPADPLPGARLSIVPATDLNPGALGDAKFEYRANRGTEVEFVAEGGDPTGEWVVTPGAIAYGGMEFRQTGPNRFWVKIIAFNQNAGSDLTRYIIVQRGSRTARLVLYEQN